VRLVGIKKEATDLKNSRCGKLPIKLVDIFVCMCFAQDISIPFIHIFYSIQEFFLITV